MSTIMNFSTNPSETKNSEKNSNAPSETLPTIREPLTRRSRTTVSKKLLTRSRQLGDRAEALTRLQNQRRARKSLLPFIQTLKANYVADPFHAQLCGIMERFHAKVVARQRPREIVIAPPQHGKSTVMSRFFPAWAYGKSPDMAVILGAYASDWAESLDWK